ncbi:helix-turn-helix domain-containing protein [Actinomadura xylanilytica]|uniref:helix-turn-helix domain-containing protein n=1 Tax=Actinomadura xylanilytica TaxID=887459 RepID=UPI00255ABD70|nr:helix-turn-helix transcriptional regulator [Actinomadura xylanilytica]MDL4772741.1 helix-turn-helix transcriptional regulator [Actinomadura xylanilytica]
MVEMEGRSMPRRRDVKPDSLRSHFGAKLRRRREALDFTLERLGDEMGYTPQWIHKMETTDKAVPQKFAEDAATYFDDPEFVEIRDVIQRAGRRAYLPPGFPQFIELEDEATSVRAYVVQVIPGLLQAESYARAVMSAGQTPEALDEIVAARMERKPILTRVPLTQFQFVINEAALRVPVGGDEVMREQIQRLIDMAGLPNVQIRVLPFSSVTYAALDGLFTILGFQDGAESVYIEGPELAQVIEDPEVIARCVVRFGIIMGEALPRAASLDLLGQYLKEHT